MLPLVACRRQSRTCTQLEASRTGSVAHTLPRSELFTLTCGNELPELITWGPLVKARRLTAPEFVLVSIGRARSAVDVNALAAVSIDDEVISHVPDLIRRILSNKARRLTGPELEFGSIGRARIAGNVNTFSAERVPDEKMFRRRGFCGAHRRFLAAPGAHCRFLAAPGAHRRFFAAPGAQRSQRPFDIMVMTRSLVVVVSIARAIHVEPPRSYAI